jgi:hypothetical protein
MPLLGNKIGVQWTNQVVHSVVLGDGAFTQGGSLAGGLSRAGTEEVEKRTSSHALEVFPVT